MKIENLNNSVVADHGMVATSQPLASKAGLSMLQQGGNAIDAAIASAIALTVVEPTSNGIGGDAFAIVWDGNKLHGLNASGKSPAQLDLGKARQMGVTSMPEEGWLSVTVPGAPAAWQDLHSRFGKLSLQKIFEPAIEYAENGFEVSPVVAFNWHKAVERFSQITDPACRYWMQCFSKNKRAPDAGQKWFFPDHARTLHTLLNKGIDDFYKGDIAQSIVDFSQLTAGYISQEDLAAHKNNWVDPMSMNYRGVDVYELPPNGQGLAALMALSILSQQPFNNSFLADCWLHQQIESMKLACVDAYQYITDPANCKDIEQRLLDPAYLQTRASLITDKAGNPSYGTPPKSGTVYLAAADNQGMMVSYIQSNYEGFGSGIVIPDSGIALQNRGASFSLNEAHPNVLAAAKRPFHTIIPGFLMKDGQPLGPFGVMGGFMQPQGHLQVVSAMVDAGLDPQSALDMPRWRIVEEKNVEIESGIGADTVNHLKQRGHAITIPSDVTAFGRGQIILKHNGQLIGGSDPRADGMALGY